jgi:hypothetical protein
MALSHLSAIQPISLSTNTHGQSWVMFYTWINLSALAFQLPAAHTLLKTTPM